MDENEEVAIMQLIIHSGDAKSHAYEALRRVNEGKYQEADDEMQLAHDAMHVAHDAQTALMHKELSGEKIKISVLFLHAQDHVMTSMSEISLIEQIMGLRKIVNTLLEGRVEEASS